ncbi:MAG: dihydropteroate synthase [Cyanobacteriota bacterium]
MQTPGPGHHWRNDHSRTQVMGVINLTPDSFSDGGRYNSVDAAVAQAERMARQGADLIDLGAQSTRPGAQLLEAPEEIGRLMPALNAIVAEWKAAPDPIPEPCDGTQGPDVGLPVASTRTRPLISIDTFRASVAAQALEAGADWINDVSGGRSDPGMLPLIAEAGCPYVLMHSRGDSRTMDQLASYGDVVREVIQALLEATERALAAGIRQEQILWDPGLGFAKDTDHNLALLEGLNTITSQRFPVLLGPSRKRFIGAVLEEPRPRARLWGTAAVICRAVSAGVRVVRVHDVAPIVQTVRMAEVLWPLRSGRTG